MPKTVQFKANSVIYFQGDATDKVFLLRTGKVKLVYQHTVTGERVSDPLVAGEFFGVKSALGRYIQEETAFVVDDAAVVVFTIPEFENFAVTNTRTVMKMLKVFSNQLQRNHRQLAGLMDGDELRPDAGLFRVGEYYLGAKYYSRARYVFSRYLGYYPAGRYAGQAAKNLKLAEESLADREDGGGPAEKQAYLTFQKGELIFAEYEPGDSFYLIRSGHVQLVKITGEGEKITDLLQAPDIFGETAFLENSRRPVTALALDTVEALEFTSHSFEALLRTNPRISLSLLRVFATRIYSVKRRFMILSLADPQARAADVFLMLDETGAGIDKSTGRREFNITVDDIAGHAGMPREKIQEILNRFASQRRLEIFPNRIVVRNIDDFFRLVSSRRISS
jgi:CRP-like cAMP-binding protein